jgi:RNA polymerase sigma-70 factor, ECF subfamily
MNLKNLDDSSLIAMCIENPTNKRYIGELVQRYGPFIMQTVTWTLRRFTGSADDDREDLFQEVVVSLFENKCVRLKNFDSSKAGFATYLSVIAKNRVINHLRRLKKGNVDLTDSFEDSSPGIDLIAETNELLDKIHAVVPTLSAGERLFYYLYFKEFMPPENIAKLLGISIDSVYSKKAKLIDKLKTKMKPILQKDLRLL